MSTTRISLRSALAVSPTLLALSLAASPALADSGDGNHRSHETASFGRGLNTAQPGNPVNHAILPRELKVSVGGVVDFGVAGFHDIIIFKPGFSLDDLVTAGGGQLPSFAPVFVLPSDPLAPMPPGLEFLLDHIYYRGLNPAGGPPATPVTDNPYNGLNRSEPVAFLEKGDYLVICNVRPHLLDGMWAHVKVR